MKVSDLIPAVQSYMEIEDIKKGVRFISLDGRVHQPLRKNINHILELFEDTKYSPFFEPNKGSDIAPHRLKIGLFKLRRVKKRLWLNWLLLGITLVTTTAAGAVWSGVNLLENPLGIWQGLPFSLFLMLILGCHETAHYLTSHYYGMQATLPYFIPFLPFIPAGGGLVPSIGTLGAVIRMGLGTNRRALVRVGAAGPIVGFLVAIPVTILGISLSEVVPQGALEGGIYFGESLIFQFLSFVVKGPLPETSTLIIHPIAFAGWLGLLVTSLNLLPLSQLDGGHISYAVMGRKRLYLSFAVYALMLAAVISLGAYVWLVWGVLTVIFGIRHPPARDEITPLNPTDILIAVASLVILILTIMPVPVRVLGN